jgi:hypothetical protein
MVKSAYVFEALQTTTFGLTNLLYLLNGIPYPQQNKSLFPYLLQHINHFFLLFYNIPLGMFDVSVVIYYNSLSFTTFL